MGVVSSVIVISDGTKVGSYVVSIIIKSVGIPVEIVIAGTITISSS